MIITGPIWISKETELVKCLSKQEEALERFFKPDDSDKCLHSSPVSFFSY